MLYKRYLNLIFILFLENYCNSKFEYSPPKPIIVKPSTRPPSPIPEVKDYNYVPIIIGAVVITIVVAVGLAFVYIIYKRKTSQPFGPLPQQDHVGGMGRPLMPQTQNSVVPLRYGNYFNIWL